MPSTSKKAVLKRSNSSSGIPVGIPRLSRLHVPSVATRQSNLKVDNKSRSKSSTRITQSKASAEKVPRFSRSSSQTSLHDGLRFNRQRSGSLVRQTLTVPSNQLCRSAKKSPLITSAKKDNRPISDKRWQYEQTVKVQQFVACYVDHVDHNSIKSGMSIDLFVALIDALFKCIERRISITKENYIEEIPKNLARYHYLSNVKPSLMKTISAIHSWPHIIGILSWLVSLITELNEERTYCNESTKFVNEFIWNVVNRSTAEVTDEFPFDELFQQTKQFLNVNEEEHAELEREIHHYEEELEKFKHKTNKQNKKIKELEDSATTMDKKCNEHEDNAKNYDKAIKEKKSNLIVKISQIDEQLLQKQKEKEQMNIRIAAQPHKFTHMQAMRDKISALQHTLKLKQERYEHLQKMNDELDFNLSDLKKQVETDSHTHNNIVTKMKLINCDWNNLHIREGGFARIDTMEEIFEVIRLLKILTFKQTTEKENLETEIIELKEKLEQVIKELNYDEKEEKKLYEEKLELEFIFEHTKKEHEQEKEIILGELERQAAELTQLKSSKLDLKPLQEELEKLKESELQLQEYKRKIHDNALYFFTNIESQMMEVMNFIMNSIEEIDEKLTSKFCTEALAAKERMEHLKESQKVAMEEANAILKRYKEIVSSPKP